MSIHIRNPRNNDEAFDMFCDVIERIGRRILARRSAAELFGGEAGAALVSQQGSNRTMTITLSPRTEELLCKVAALHGEDPEPFADSLLAEALEGRRLEAEEPDMEIVAAALEAIEDAKV